MVHFVRTLFGGIIVPMILETRKITVTIVLSDRYKKNDFIIWNKYGKSIGVR